MHPAYFDCFPILFFLKIMHFESVCSGYNDLEDKTETWKFCGGKVALFYVWMGCYEIGCDTDNFMNLFIRTLGEDTNEEDG